MQWTRTIQTVLVEGHPRIICVKYFEIGQGAKEELSFKSIVNGWMMDKDRSQKLTLSPTDRLANY